MPGLLSLSFPPTTVTLSATISHSYLVCSRALRPLFTVRRSSPSLSPPGSSPSNTSIQLLCLIDIPFHNELSNRTRVLRLQIPDSFISSGNYSENFHHLSSHSLSGVELDPMSLVSRSSSASRSSMSPMERLLHWHSRIVGIHFLCGTI